MYIPRIVSDNLSEDSQVVIPGSRRVFSDDFSDNIWMNFGLISTVFLGYAVRFLGYNSIKLTGNAGCSGITYMGTFSE